jgi:hypothetical protein
MRVCPSYMMTLVAPPPPPPSETRYPRCPDTSLTDPARDRWVLGVDCGGRSREPKRLEGMPPRQSLQAWSGSAQGMPEIMMDGKRLSLI